MTRSRLSSSVPAILSATSHTTTKGDRDPLTGPIKLHEGSPRGHYNAVKGARGEREVGKGDEFYEKKGLWDEMSRVFFLTE